MTMWNIAPRSVNLQGVCLVDEAHGWAVGDGGMILATRDGGSSWSPQGDTDKDLRAVSFVDTLRGWAAGRDGILLHTEDGGRHWRRQDSGTERNLYGVSFAPSGRTGWAVGDDGTVLASRDGGHTWQPQRTGADAHFTRCFAQDDRVAWIVGKKGRILATTDAGATWTVQESGTAADLRGVFAVSPAGAGPWDAGAPCCGPRTPAPPGPGPTAVPNWTSTACGWHRTGARSGSPATTA